MPRVSGHQFTIEDALRVVEAAGLDASRPPTDQQNGQPDLSDQIRSLEAKVDQLAKSLSPPADEPPVNAQEARARGLATALDNAQSQWFTTGAE